MIIDLKDAKKANPNVTQDQLDALEQFVRAETKNSFHNKRVRFCSIRTEPPDMLYVSDIKGLRVGDTVEINYSAYNNGLYVIDEIVEDSIKVKSQDLFEESGRELMLSKVEYPADIKQGLLGILEYDAKMADKTGLKSRSISRMSETYHDLTKSESKGGRPAYLFSFLENYYKYG